jgi:hypothetical protein
MDAPTHYDNITPKALEVRDAYNLTDVQTLMYNHICRGDFKLRNDDGQKFYDKNNNGFGWSGNRSWVKKQLKKLIDDGLVSFTSLHDCRHGAYTSWYFYSPDHDLNDLIDASCYVSVHKLAMVKHVLNLPDGFDKNGQYGDMKFIHDSRGYSVNYKGEENIYAWDHNGKGEKKDLTWLTGKLTYSSPIYKQNFQELIHDVWSFLAHDGHKYLNRIPDYTERRQFTLS